MKKFLLVILSVCLFGFGFSYVSADDISYKRLNNIYFNLTVDGKFESNHVTMFILDGRLAYCIEPGKDINTKYYDAFRDWSVSSLSKEKQKYIEKLGYYGYEYPGHQTDKYYIATQELIWKTVKKVDIKWTTEKDNGGSVIDVETEKNEILNLINQNDKIPSFADEVIQGKVGETIEIEDANKVLTNYEINDSAYHDIEVQGNKIKITFNNEEQEEEEISLKQKIYDKKTLLIYNKAGSQQLAALRISNPEEIKIKLKNYKEPEEIVKVPSTAFEDTKHFNVKWTTTYDKYRFN